MLGAVTWTSLCCQMWRASSGTFGRYNPKGGCCHRQASSRTRIQNGECGVIIVVFSFNIRYDVHSNYNLDGKLYKMSSYIAGSGRISVGRNNHLTSWATCFHTCLTEFRTPTTNINVTSIAMTLVRTVVLHIGTTVSKISRKVGSYSYTMCCSSFGKHHFRFAWHFMKKY